MNKINQEISKHKLLEIEISRILNQVKISDENKRDLLLSGFFNNYICHFKSIYILMEQKLYNTAFALIRILFENSVRAIYMYKTFEDKKIDKMYEIMYSQNPKKDWEFNSVGSMCNELDKKYGSDYFGEIKKIAYTPMNDYTHTGANQIARNFDEKGQLTSNFNESIIIDTLESTYTLTKIFTTIYFENVRLTQGIITTEYLNNFSEKY